MRFEFDENRYPIERYVIVSEEFLEDSLSLLEEVKSKLTPFFFLSGVDGAEVGH